ncbi:hypothetical protein HanRHA438_Chr17g0835991 [Helianthus annuus]|nr:hypothetical protein HanRHA438_Chr17g0835991 [Helianthus annuus]
MKNALLLTGLPHGTNTLRGSIIHVYHYAWSKSHSDISVYVEFSFTKGLFGSF